jgi:hypothetical protein
MLVTRAKVFILTRVVLKLPAQEVGCSFYLLFLGTNFQSAKRNRKRYSERDVVEDTEGEYKR